MFEVVIKLPFIDNRYFYSCFFETENRQALYETLIDEKEANEKKIKIHFYEKNESLKPPLKNLHSVRLIDSSKRVIMHVVRLEFEGEENDEDGSRVKWVKKTDHKKSKMAIRWKEYVSIDLEKKMNDIQEKKIFDKIKSNEDVDDIVQNMKQINTMPKDSLIINMNSMGVLSAKATRTSNSSFVSCNYLPREGTFKTPIKVPLNEYTPSYTMDQKFYSALCTPHDRGAYAKMMEYVQDFYRKNKSNLSTPADFLREVKSYAMKRVYFFKYDNDFETRNMEDYDELDPCLELTGEGDCEDIAHFMVRFIRMLVQYARVFHVDQCPLEGWTPYFSICQLNSNEDHGAVIVMKGNQMLALEPTQESDDCVFDISSDAKSYFRQYNFLFYIVSNLYMIPVKSDKRKGTIRFGEPFCY